MRRFRAASLLMVTTVLVILAARQAWASSLPPEETNYEFVPDSNYSERTMYRAPDYPATPIPVIQEPEPLEEAPLEETEWCVSEGWSDGPGNVLSVFNFCTTQFAEAYELLSDEYESSWPLGPLVYEPVNLSPTQAIGICANVVRECSAQPYSYGYDNLRKYTASQLYDYSYEGPVGMIQWNGGRRNNFIKWCSVTERDPRNIETNCLYLAYEYYASSENESYHRDINYAGNSVNFFTYAEEEYPTRESVEAAAEAFRVRVERTSSVAEGLNTAILEDWANRWDDSWGAKPNVGLYGYLLDYMDTHTVT